MKYFCAKIVRDRDFDSLFDMKVDRYKLTAK